MDGASDLYDSTNSSDLESAISLSRERTRVTARVSDSRSGEEAEVCECSRHPNRSFPPVSKLETRTGLGPTLHQTK